MTIEEFLTLIQGVRRSNRGWVGRCPSHDDAKPSLSIAEGQNRRVMVHCHAGCSPGDICGALGIATRDLFPKTRGSGKLVTATRAKGPSINHKDASACTIKKYPILDEHGTLVAIHERVENASGKTFRWRQPNGRSGLGGRRVTELPLYGSRRLKKWPGDSLVIVTEGEKACEALRRKNLPAVGTVTGAATIPGQGPLSILVGHSVSLWADNDEPGRSHMRRIGERLRALGVEDIREVRWSAAPDGGDAADFSGTEEELRTLLAAAEVVPIEETYTLTRVAAITPKSLGWLWKGLLPQGKLTVLDGDPGSAKSLVTVDITSRVSRGLAMPDGTKGDLGGARGVLMLSAEDDPADTIRPRLEAAGADLSRIGILSAVRDADAQPRPPDLGDIETLRSAIRELDAALVIVDPLMAYLPGNRDSHRDQDIRRVLAPLASLANESGAAILVVRHLNKTSNGNPLYRGGGSIGIIGAARSGLLVARDPDDPTGLVRVLVTTKSNLSASSTSLRYRVAEIQGIPRIAWLGTSTQTATTLLAAAGKDEHSRSKRKEAAAWLQEVLASGAMPSEQMLDKAQKAGLAEKTLRRAGDELGVKIYKPSFKEGWRWMLPLEGSAKMANQTKMASKRVAILGSRSGQSSTRLPKPTGASGTNGIISPILLSLTEKGREDFQ